MDVSAQVLAEELAPLAAHLNLPVAALVLAMLLVLGLLGHLLITVLLCLFRKQYICKTLIDLFQQGL